MRLVLLISTVFFFCSNVYAQYTPGAINYGLAAIKTFDAPKSVGAGARVEYAYNCYTTYMAEYNHFLSGKESININELALGVNLILFNWHPTTITAGMGYLINDNNEFEDEEATLVFQTGNINHGVQVKFRSLYQLSGRVHVFGELNLKSLGADYHNFLIGFNYNFNPRR